jgi:hypothetical protein
MKIIFIVILLIGFIGLIFVHEQVHVQINLIYGIESHVEYFSNFPNVVTISDGDWSKCTSDCKLAHNINEIVGYPLIVCYIVFCGGLLIIIEALTREY